MSNSTESQITQNKRLLLLLALVGAALFGSNECCALDISPSFSNTWNSNTWNSNNWSLSDWKTKSISTPFVNSSFKLNDTPVLFASDQEPYLPYQRQKLEPIFETPQLLDIDNQPCLDCDETETLFDEPMEVFSLRHGTHRFFSLLWEDTRDTVTLKNGLLLGVALGGSLAIRSNLDDNVRRYTARSPNRWGDASVGIGKFGEAQFQIPALLLLYSYSKYQKNDHLHDVSVSLLSAYTMTALSTVAIKAIANTERPSDRWSNGQYGFPSFHTSTNFAMAAVIEEYYGLRAGIPAYALAGLVGWSRIDERDHDLSDVVFGAALGYVIGKSIAGKHRLGNSDLQISPYYHPISGTSGIQFEFSF